MALHLNELEFPLLRDALCPSLVETGIVVLVAFSLGEDKTYMY